MPGQRMARGTKIAVGVVMIVVVTPECAPIYGGRSPPELRRGAEPGWKEVGLPARRVRSSDIATAMLGPRMREDLRSPIPNQRYPVARLSSVEVLSTDDVEIPDNTAST